MTPCVVWRASTPTGNSVSLICASDFIQLYFVFPRSVVKKPKQNKKSVTRVLDHKVDLLLVVCIQLRLVVVSSLAVGWAINTKKTQDSSVGRAPDSWSKGCEFESRQERRNNFLLQGYFLCWLLFGVHSASVLPRWYVRDTDHSAKSAGGRLHLNTHTFWTQWNRSELTMLSSHSMGTYQGNELTRNSSGTLGYSCLSSLSHCWLILAQKSDLMCPSRSPLKKEKKKKKKKKIKKKRKKKQAGTGIDSSKIFFHIPHVRGKSHDHHQLPRLNKSISSA